MPLRDHFHPPLADSHPWEAVHAAWLGSIRDALNATLPTEYYALAQTHVGPNVEIDVATFGPGGRPRVPPAERPDLPGGNGVAVALAPAAVAAPPAPATFPIVLSDDFEIKVIGDRSGRHLVAAIELVSEGNKDRPDTRRAFAIKCANYLHHGVAVIIIDIVTSRSGDLHRETLDLVGCPGRAAPVPGDAPLYAAAYRPIRRRTRAEADVWVEPVGVGAGLPTLPLWLNAGENVPVELEPTYTDACRRLRLPV